MVRDSVLSVLGVCLLVGCSCVEPERSMQKSDAEGAIVRLVTLDPGHYHAALVQKSMYEQVDRVVHVYAPEGHEAQKQSAAVSNRDHTASGTAQGLR